MENINGLYEQMKQCLEDFEQAKEELAEIESTKKDKELERDERFGDLDYDISKDFVDNADYDCSELEDCFWDFAESRVDIYTNELYEWVKYHEEEFEDYVTEFGYDNKVSLTVNIERAQAMFYEHQLYEDEDIIRDIADLDNEIIDLDHDMEEYQDLVAKLEEQINELQNLIESIEAEYEPVHYIDEYEYEKMEYYA